MVQRLAPEKDTVKCLEALAELVDGPRDGFSLDGKRPTHLVIAGHVRRGGCWWRVVARGERRVVARGGAW